MNNKTDMNDKFSLFKWSGTEVLFVVAVVGTILGISLVQLAIGEKKTRDAQRKADVELVARALERYFVDYERYPAASESGRIASCGYMGHEACDWGGEAAMVDEEGVEYLKNLPQDPQVEMGRRYVYWVNETGSQFKIFVALEYTKDEAYRKDLTEMCGDGIQCSWYVQSR